MVRALGDVLRDGCAACSSSTTTRRTARARSPTSSRPSSTASPSCTGRARRASAPRTSPASGRRSPTAPSSCSRWTATSRTTRRDVPRLIAAAERRRPRARLALRRRRRASRTGAPLRRFVSRGGSLYAQVLLGVPVRDLTGGFKCFRRAVLEALDLDEIDSKGYAFQIETTYRAIREGLPRRRDPDHVRRPRGGRLEDEQRDRRRGGVEGAGAARPRARRAAISGRGRRHRRDVPAGGARRRRGRWSSTSGRRGAGRAGRSTRSSRQLAAEHEGRVRFVKLNIDENLATAGRYGVLSIPTAILFADGEERAKVDRRVPALALRAGVGRMAHAVDLDDVAGAGGIVVQEHTRCWSVSAARTASTGSSRPAIRAGGVVRGDDGERRLRRPAIRRIARLVCTMLWEPEHDSTQQLAYFARRRSTRPSARAHDGEASRTNVVEPGRVAPASSTRCTGSILARCEIARTGFHIHADVTVEPDPHESYGSLEGEGAPSPRGRRVNRCDRPQLGARVTDQ